jgi:hypothetical protein
MDMLLHRNLEEDNPVLLVLVAELLESRDKRQVTNIEQDWQISTTNQTCETCPRGCMARPQKTTLHALNRSSQSHDTCHVLSMQTPSQLF